MTTYEMLDLVVQALGMLLVACSLVLVGLQVRVLRKSHVEEHLWNRRKAAQDATQLFAQRVGTTAPLEKQFKYMDRDDPIPLSELVKAFEENLELRTTLHRLLNYHESLARGVNIKVYDERVIEAAWGGVMARTMYVFSSYVEKRRSTKSPNAWRELECLLTKWKAEGNKSVLATDFTSLGF